MSLLIRKILPCVLGAGLVFASGCATVKEARRVQNEQEAQLPGEYTVKSVNLGIKAGSELSLKQLEEAALAGNPAVLQAQLAVEQARIALDNARAGYLPALSANAGHSRRTNNTDRHSFSTGNSGSYSAGVNFNITLYDFGQTDAAVRQAQLSLLAAEEDYRAARSKTVYDVRTAFFELKRAFDLYDVATESVGQYKEHLDQVRLKKEIGSGMSYDVIKAEVDYNNAQLNEITAEHNIQVGWATLNLALGIAENPEYKLGRGKIREYDNTAEELMQMARNTEPALLALGYKVAQASAAVDGAVAKLLPSFALNLGSSFSGDNPGLPWLWNLTLGLTGTANIFNGGKDMAAINNAVLNLRLARSRYAAREQSVYKNLRVGVLTAQRAKRQLEVAKLAEVSARQNLNIVNEKFKLGKASSVDRTDAQVSYSTAKANVVKAIFDYEEAQAALAYLIGE
jgi:outer membrane protein TolC